MNFVWVATVHVLIAESTTSAFPAVVLTTLRYTKFHTAEIKHVEPVLSHSAVPETRGNDKFTIAMQSLALFIPQTLPTGVKLLLVNTRKSRSENDRMTKKMYRCVPHGAVTKSYLKLAHENGPALNRSK